MSGGFFYECEVCKTKIPATFDDPTPETVVPVVKKQGDVKSETTFRCKTCAPQGSPSMAPASV